MSRSVLVTGATSGIGLATALHLSELGFHVLGSARTQHKAERLVEAAEQAGVEVEPMLFDVTDADACERAMADRTLYGLVNNAGYYNVGTVVDVPPGDALRQLETMVVAPMRLARLALPAMRERSEGRIVNVSSSLVHLTGPLTGWYQASKAALSAVSDALRIEVSSFGVEVVLIEPGGIETDIWRKAEDDLLRHRAGSHFETAYDRARRILHALVGRMHPPEAVAEVIGTALTAGRPRANYWVGAEAVALRWGGPLVPTALRDRLARTVLGL
ncbi:MAG: SDR family NAD(P)-dependent oxidoreductase [Actinobacteria bacterium]|nr:SDR family NAD(P)-dependent oxidoreductase [Actinomycetota bacterium]